MPPVSLQRELPSRALRGLLDQRSVLECLVPTFHFLSFLTGSLSRLRRLCPWRLCLPVQVGISVGSRQPPSLVSAMEGGSEALSFSACSVPTGSRLGRNITVLGSGTSSCDLHPEGTSQLCVTWRSTGTGPLDAEACPLTSPFRRGQSIRAYNCQNL